MNTRAQTDGPGLYADASFVLSYVCGAKCRATANTEGVSSEVHALGILTIPVTSSLCHRLLHLGLCTRLSGLLLLMVVLVLLLVVVMVV